MKHVTEQRATFGLRAALAGLGLLAGLVMVQPGEIQASVSGGATIFNEATVSYSTPTLGAKTAKGSTTVTVLTKAAPPFATITPPTQTTGENSTVTYTYSIINKSNGSNSLTVGNPPATTPSATINAATGNALANYSWGTPFWGGVILSTVDNGAGPGTSTIDIPAGTQPAVGTKVAVVGSGGTVYYYTVTAATAGTVASPGVGETHATVTLTPVGTTPRLDTTIGATGTIIGEYRTDVYTQTTSTLINPATTGTYTTKITVTATDSTTSVAYTTDATDNNVPTTTVLKDPMTVVKTASPTTAKPGDVVTYTIEVTNNTTDATTAASIADPVSSPYVTYNAGTTKLNTVAVLDNAGACPLIAGIPIKTNGQADGVILPGVANKAVIEYRVTVKP